MADVAGVPKTARRTVTVAIPSEVPEDWRFVWFYARDDNALAGELREWLRAYDTRQAANRAAIRRAEAEAEDA